MSESTTAPIASTSTKGKNEGQQGVKSEEKTSSAYHKSDRIKNLNQFDENPNNPAEKVKIVESSNDNSQEIQMSPYELIEMAVDVEEFNVTAQQKEITSNHGRNEVNFSLFFTSS